MKPKTSPMPTTLKSHNPIISRQRAYQIRHKEQGLCLLCPVVAWKHDLCRRHYEDSLIQKREYMRKRKGCSRRNMASHSYWIEIERSRMKALAAHSKLVKELERRGIKPKYTSGAGVL